MATPEEYAKIEIIRAQNQKSKAEHRPVEMDLASGKLAYAHKALCSVRRALAWASITSFVGVILLFALNIWSVIVGRTGGNFSILSGMFVLACIEVVAVILSSKAYTLEVTPRFTLGVLIFLLCWNLLFFVGILPLVSVVMIIVALCQYSTYKTWFYALKKTATAKHKDEAPKNTSCRTVSVAVVATSSAISAFVALIIGLLIGTAALSIQREPLLAESYNEGYEAAKSEYTNIGYSSGYYDGNTAGYKKGYEDGKRCMGVVGMEIMSYGSAVTDVYSCYAP